MHIIVVGAGPVGEHLVDLSLKAGHDVVLIEADDNRAEQCAQAYDALVLNAAIDQEDILDEAGADHAHALIATTDDDSTNLMAMVLGQEYAIESLTSTVNGKHRKRLFDRLGVSTLVDPEILAARHLLDLVLHPGTENVTSLVGKGQIYELQLAADSELVDRDFNGLEHDKALPDGCFIVLIQRDGKRLFPHGDTTLKADDALLVFSADSLSKEALSLFTGSGD